jgi:hypothetical protein
MMIPLLSLCSVSVRASRMAAHLNTSGKKIDASFFLGIFQLQVQMAQAKGIIADGLKGGWTRARLENEFTQCSPIDEQKTAGAGLVPDYY